MFEFTSHCPKQLPCTSQNPSPDSSASKSKQTESTPNILLVNHDNLANPFMTAPFLTALEQTACVSSKAGWLPSHIQNRNTGLFMPSYIKNHSYGEYVFDWSWADAYQRYQHAYYPKLLTAIPFTPVTSPKYMTTEPVNLEKLTEFGKNACFEHHLSSWHINFIPQSFAEQLNQLGFILRTQIQFEWFNQSYQSFEHYLTHFTSRKRKQVNKERKDVQHTVDRIEHFTGNELTEVLIKDFYSCYQMTYLKRGNQGYLNEAFFQLLRHTMSNNMLIIAAYKNNKMVASALFFYNTTHLYGRYWGDQEDIKYLHFELCYYQGIEFAIKHNLQCFNPGTQGEHKISRGFQPVKTYSAHWLKHSGFHDAIQHFCNEETQHYEQYQLQCQTKLPFKT